MRTFHEEELRIIQWKISRLVTAHGSDTGNEAPTDLLHKVGLAPQSFVQGLLVGCSWPAALMSIFGGPDALYDFSLYALSVGC